MTKPGHSLNGLAYYDTPKTKSVKVFEALNELAIKHSILKIILKYFLETGKP